MRTENMKSKPSENSELSRIEIFIKERISGQNQNEVNHKQKVLQKLEGTKKDEIRDNSQRCHSQGSRSK